MISEEQIQKIKDQNDIVDIISESVKLKRAGRNFTGICPFHHEKTPSFSVSEEKQIYKCFGCGEAGNVITFVMKSRNLSFLEAVKFLAEKANIEIDLESGKNKIQKDINEKLYKLNVEAARYFYANLNKNKGAMQYFLGRGILEGTIKKFGLGFAANGWNELLKFLKSKGYTELDLLSGGFIIKSPKGTLYDRFRNRVIFPVFDYRGKVIGFGGRVLDDSKPKYLNSPETNLFKKGTNLYGLNFAIKNLVEQNLLIVEGYMDCITLHQYGITNVVASLGTALTVHQAKLLKRYVNKIVISYDADLAGQTATIRGLEILRKEGFEVRVLIVPQGKDPDQFVRNNGREAFIKLINDALPLLEYRIKRAAEGINFSNRDMVIQYAKSVTEILADLDPVEKDVYIKKISEDTGIKEQAIYDLLTVEMQKNVKHIQEVNTGENFGQKLYLEPAYVKAERLLLRYMLKGGSFFESIKDRIVAEEFVLDSHKKIYRLIIETADFAFQEGQRKIEAKCTDIESAKEWINIIETETETLEGEYDFNKLIKDYIREIKKFKLEESKKEIMNRIKQYEMQGFIEESSKLAQQSIEIQKEIARL